MEQPNSSILDNLPLPKLEACFDSKSNRYWIKNSAGRWIPYTKEDTKVELGLLGYPMKKTKQGDITEAERELARIRRERDVVFIGQVAGNKSGLNNDHPVPYLVTQGPQLPEPVKGSWDTIKELGIKLFGEGQLEYVLGWSKTALEGLYKGDFKHRQMLVLAGPPGCGKSFWQNRVITPMLGGRVARPIQYMTGKTSFNYDLIEAEHLLLEDDSSKVDIHSRRELGTSIKNFTVNNTQRVHAKGRDGFVLTSYHWMSMSLNDEAENLHILPPFDESIEDKITLLKCMRAITSAWPLVKGTPFEEKIESEIAAFNYYLLHEHEIRDEVKDIRFGVKHFHHPDLITEIQSLAPESELETMIEYIFPEMVRERKLLTLTAAELQSALERDSEISWRVKKLLTFPTACGVYLDRLHKRNGRKYTKPKKGDNPRKWSIDFSK